MMARERFHNQAGFTLALVQDMSRLLEMRCVAFWAIQQIIRIEEKANTGFVIRPLEQTHFDEDFAIGDFPTRRGTSVRLIRSRTLMTMALHGCKQNTMVAAILSKHFCLRWLSSNLSMIAVECKIHHQKSGGTTFHAPFREEISHCGPVGSSAAYHELARAGISHDALTCGRCLGILKPTSGFSRWKTWRCCISCNQGAMSARRLTGPACCTAGEHLFAQQMGPWHRPVEHMASATKQKNRIPTS
jgi:hypothetical protein